MPDAVVRLQRTKMILTCLVLVLLGAALIGLGNHVNGWHLPGWLTYVPWSELGGILVGAGLLSVWLDFLFRREQADVDEMRLRQLLTEQAPVMRDAVIEAFAANKTDLARVATPELLDQIIRNSLALRLHDDQFATEIYNDLRDQAIGASERWYDATLSIKLSPRSMDKGSASGRTLPRRAIPLFDVTVRWEYTVVPAHAQRRFACVSDRQEYTELVADRGATSAWFLKPKEGVDGRN